MKNAARAGVLLACVVGAVGLMASGAANGIASGAANAFSSMLATPTAVGVLDLQKLYAEGKLAELTAMNDRLRATGQARQAELDEIAKKLEQMGKEAELKPKRSPERLEIEAKGVVLKAQYEAQVRAYQSVIDIEKGDVLRTMYAKILDATKTIAERDGFDIVLLDDRSVQVPDGLVPNNVVQQSMQSRRVMFAKDQLDITERVATLLNNEFNAPKR
jgi:Skp family chaperone for outer membrane proteins